MKTLESNLIILIIIIIYSTQKCNMNTIVQFKLQITLIKVEMSIVNNI